MPAESVASKLVKLAKSLQQTCEILQIVNKTLLTLADRISTEIESFHLSSYLQLLSNIRRILIKLEKIAALPLVGSEHAHCDTEVDG